MSAAGQESRRIRSFLVSGCAKGSLGMCGTNTGKWKCPAVDVQREDMMAEHMSMSSTVYLVSNECESRNDVSRKEWESSICYMVMSMRPSMIMHLAVIMYMGGMLVVKN